MTERRTRNFVVAMTPTERAILQRLSERDGVSGAEVVRRLILSEARRPTCAVLDVTGGESGKVSYGVNVVIKG